MLSNVSKSLFEEKNNKDILGLTKRILKKDNTTLSQFPRESVSVRFYECVTISVKIPS